MCGIIGYTGEKEAQEIMLDALEVLEYRGYDSAGIAVCGSEAKVQIRKCAGRVKDLRSSFASSTLSLPLTSMHQGLNIPP